MNNLMTFIKKNQSTLIKLALLISLILGTYLFVNHLFTYVSPFVFGYIISLIPRRPVAYLEKRFGISRGLTGFIFLLLIMTIIYILGFNLISTLITQGRSFVTMFNTYSEQAQGLFSQLASQYEHLLNFIPDELSSALPSLIESLRTWAVDYFGALFGDKSMNIVFVLPGFVMQFVITFLCAFFFIKDKPIIDKTVAAIIPKSVQRGAGTMKEGMLKALVGYVKAQLIIMSVTSSICILGLTLLGQPVSLFLGLGIAFVDALPIFGSGLILIPWCLYMFIVGDYAYAIGLAIIYGSVFISRQLLEPKVLSNQIGIHPILTLFSIYVGVKIFGFAGFLIGPVIMVIGKIITTWEPRFSDL